MGEKILLVGFACIDIVLVCKCYPPEEDTSHRVKNVLKRRGGNCSNSSSMLRQLETPCQLLTSFGNDADAEYVFDGKKTYTVANSDVKFREVRIFKGKWARRDLTDIGVVLTHCPTIQYPSPVTYIILSEETGSRTTFLYKRVFPGPKYEDFLKHDLSEFKWVHFEGRNLVEVMKMIRHVREWNKGREKDKQLKLSVEIEREDLATADLIPLGDVVIISKDFAKFVGLNSMEKVIQQYKNVVRSDATIVVPWGELGATAYLPDGTIYVSPAYPPPQVIDTLAAGDSFIAALISILSQKKSIQEAVAFACRAAGAKVGIMGFDGLRELLSKAQLKTT